MTAAFDRQPRERFFAKEDDSAGVGLGLPLSRRLARLLGGELRAVGRPEGGSYFILALPALLDS